MPLNIETAKELISEANSLGVQLSLVGDEVKLKAKEKPPTELIEQLRQHKPLIIQVLKPQKLSIQSLADYGLELIPCDIKYLMQRLPIGDERQELLRRYIECWLQGMASEPIDHKKQNAGRRKANLMILSNIILG